MGSPAPPPRIAVTPPHAVQENEASVQGNPVFTTQQMQQIFTSTGMPNPKGTFHDLLEHLNHQNYILKKGPGQWKVETSGVRYSQA